QVLCRLATSMMRMATPLSHSLRGIISSWKVLRLMDGHTVGRVWMRGAKGVSLPVRGRANQQMLAFETFASGKSTKVLLEWEKESGSERRKGHLGQGKGAGPHSGCGRWNRMSARQYGAGFT